MKIKTFSGEAGEVEVAFNNWAKGKALNKDIIIHTSVHHIFDKRMITKLSIVVLYPEGSRWDTEPEQPFKLFTDAEKELLQDKDTGAKP
jgi:hypothetical protein